MNILQLLAREGESVKARMMAVRIHGRRGREAIRGRVADILARGSNIHVRDEDGNTALMYAVGSGDAELVRLLVRAGAEVNTANERGMTPLMYAAMLDAPEVVWALIEAEADVAARDADGYSAFMYAVQYASPEVMKLLHPPTAPEGEVNACSAHGWTLLSLAAMHNASDAVQQLLNFGARVNAPGKWGMTPLMCAVHRGVAGEHVLRTLLDAGADPRQATNDGDTAYTFAENSDNSLALSLFREYATMPKEEQIELNCELISALYHGEDADHIRALIEAGADANADDGCGSTALHLAVERNAPAIVRLLIEGGARLNTLNAHGWTPLYCAAEESRVECARLLLQAGADACVGEASCSVLHKAAAWKSSELLRMLLPLGPDLEVRGEGGQTPLFYAAQFGCSENLSLLLEAGADANARDHHGLTPLMSLYEDCIADEADAKHRLLLTAGAEMLSSES